MPPRARQPGRAKSSGAPSPATAERAPATPTASPTSADFEKLGVFYLGRPYDLAAKQPEPGLLLYDSKDLVDPRGLRRHDGQRQDRALPRAASRRPRSTASRSSLIDPEGRPRRTSASPSRSSVRRTSARGSTRTTRGGRGSPVDAYAAQQAELWRKGLAAWGQDGARIQRLREAADVAIYTPGSTAGLPVSIVKSFAAPPGRCARRRRAVPRAHRDHRHEPPRAARDRGRPAAEPRAHPAREASSRPRGARAGTSTCRA